MPSTQNTGFSSAYNYLKRYASGSVEETVAGSFAEVTGSIPHDLGYVPAARAYYQVAGGSLFPMTSSVTIVPTLTIGDSVVGSFAVTDTELQYYLRNEGGSSKDVTIYYIIYLDEVA
ncbi:hypothetical protein KC963_03700 [Candidatus Saccharibacteria bacterium]|nr:hypothetical protein [Candidatus Saccharibacteria bacterium]